MPFVYANPGSGPSAGGIGWFNFENISITPGSTITGLTGTLNDGSTVTFDLTSTNVSGAARNFTANPTPTWGGAFFGNSNYTGIIGNVAMQTNFVFAPGSNTLTLSNIVVKDSLGNIIPNYTAIVSDAESTGIAETWNFGTNGGGWKLFATLGSSTSPTLTGVGTPNVSFVGNDPTANQNDYVFTTQSPSNLTFNTVTTSTGGGNQAIAIGFATTRVRLVKNIGERIDSNDQFIMSISGTPNDQATTAGAVDGIQTQVATVDAIPGNTYTVTESMAVGSVSPLSAYMTVVSAVNLTPGGTVPTIGALPRSVTTALGDDIVYVVLNSAPQKFEKKVDKAFADIGEVITYTISVINPNNYALNNVVITDPTPIGTTYIGNIISSTPFIGTDPATGLTLTTVAADSTATVSWQVKANASGPIVTPIANLATVVVPGGTSGSTNIATTQISHADLTSTGNFTKSVDKAYANTTDELTYTLNIKNTGNVPANNIVITDILPIGTTYVPGSVSGTVHFTGTPETTINLTVPVAAGGTAVIMYKVKLNGIPTVNPVFNTAKIDYAYTVDPTEPNGVDVSGISNTATTTVANANLKIVKSVNKTISYVGEELTYTFALTNTGNTSANNVVLTDVIPFGTTYVPGSLTVSVPNTSVPPTSISLTSPVAPGETVIVTFKVKVTSMPAVNPLQNKGESKFDFTLDPSRPNGEKVTNVSNIVKTIIFRNNFSQQISDLVQSVALEEAAIANIANAEGAKIQKMVSMSSITTEELLCLNKSVSEMTDSLSTLTSILKKKLSIVECQINGTTTC